MSADSTAIVRTQLPAQRAEPPAGAAVDPSRCPVCGGPNRCAMELERSTGMPQPPCWCTRERIPQSALDRIPAQGLGLACLCPACAR